MRRKIALETGQTDLRECARHALYAARYVISEKDLKVELDLPSAPVIVDADSVRLEQMIGNVLGNAVKFTPVGGTIRVALEVAEGEAVLHVADTGVGIPPEHLGHVFDLFAQAPRALDRSEGGLGIGLTVVRLLAELHGGHADIYSEGAGTGTEVVLRLPVVLSAAFRQTRADSGLSSPGNHRRILVIEDNHDAAEMLAVYLQQVGHRVLIAHDGDSGLETALRHHPDVLICDIGLPGVDGYAIAKRLRQESSFESCLMIAITGYGETADRERARKAGFAHHLTKPADPIKVADLIAAASGLDSANLDRCPLSH
jgi:CheY-like chemotaxis protein